MTPDQLKDGRINKDNITIFFVGNSAADKQPMTSWNVAHRFGHSVRSESQFKELTNWLESKFKEILKLYRVDEPINIWKDDYNINQNLYGKSKANLFNQIGTMKSARDGKINRYFEFYYELFTQYLKDGKITLNRLPSRIKTGTAAYGRPIESYTNNIDEVNEILGEIERDFPYYSEDVLNSIVGDIFVM